MVEIINEIVLICVISDKKMAGYLHRTATTAYPCYLPILGEFSRSWSCKTCRCKTKRLKEKKSKGEETFLVGLVSCLAIFLSCSENKDLKEITEKRNHTHNQTSPLFFLLSLSFKLTGG